jgi:hypothetical protein
MSPIVLDFRGELWYCGSMSSPILALIVFIVLYYLWGTLWDFLLNHGKSPEQRQAEEEAYKELIKDPNYFDCLGPP